MQTILDTWRRIWSWRGRAALERGLDAELRFHLEQQIEKNRRLGMTPGESRRQALIRFGGIESTKELTRDQIRLMFLEDSWRDLRYGMRSLRRVPGFTLTASLTLALGIGATTAVFSMINAVLLADPPYAAPGRLVTITQSFSEIGDDRLGVSAPEFLDYRDRTRTFASVGGYTRATFDLTGDGAAPEPIDALRASASVFATLGASPHIGRTFATDDDRAGAAKVAVLGFDFWQRRYGGNPQVLGKTLRLNEQPYTIIGVMAAAFEFPSGNATADTPPAVWVPLSLTPQQLSSRHDNSETAVIARLAAGVSLEQARDDVVRIANEFQREHPDVYSERMRLHANVDRFGAIASRRAQPALLLLGAAVGLVLLIACANVANLLLVRATARQKEIAVRRALGAQRGRIVRQLLTEALLISGLGGVLGGLLAVGLIRATSALWQGQMISVRGVQLNETVLGFVAAISILTGLACGLVPAFEFRGHSMSEILNQAGRQSASGGRQRRRLRNGLVVFEAASALVLLVGAALLAHSFVNVLSVPLGFDPDGVLIVRTSFNRERYPDADRRHNAERQIVQGLAALPGVTAVGLTTHVPLADQRTIGFALARERPGQFQFAANALVSPEYFAAMKIPIVRGRGFTDADIEKAPLVAVINETLARRYWPNRDPLGEEVLWGGRRLAIVGVAGDVHISGVDADVDSTIYCSVYQIESGATTSAVFIIRSGGDPATASAARAVIQLVDAGLPAFDIRPLTQIVGRSLAQRRFTVAAVAVFAGFALGLAVIGLYAVLSQAVKQRMQELGIRFALGAAPRQLMTMVMSDAVRLVTAGLIIGGLVALGTVRSMSALLFGVNAVDPIAFAVAGGMLLLVSLAASYCVARRVAILDPLMAIRTE